jgi:uncharacterized LabA/DUF88 family protein
VAVGEASRLAVLIDADNASAGVVKELLEEVAKYGTATVKRAYGDWTTQNLVGWKDQLHRHAIQPVQQFGYTKGKNSTDAAFITDAMDLLYAGSVDGFCIVASDSDYTRLSANLPPLAALARQVGRVAVSLDDRRQPWLWQLVDLIGIRPLPSLSYAPCNSSELGRSIATRREQGSRHATRSHVAHLGS